MLHLIAYDIADPRRLGRVHRFVRARALAIQYSVFIVDCGDAALAELIRGLLARTNPRHDDVRIYRLPQPCRVEVLGRALFPSGVLLGHSDPVHNLQSNPVATSGTVFFGADPANQLQNKDVQPPAVDRQP